MRLGSRSQCAPVPPPEGEVLSLPEVSPSNLKEVPASSNVQTPSQDCRDQKESGKQGTTEGTDLKEIEIHELPDKEFEIIVLKMLRELQENPNIQHIKKIINHHQVGFIPGIQE